MFESIEHVFGNIELLRSMNALVGDSTAFDLLVHFCSRYLEILLIAGAALFVFFHHDSGADQWYGFRGFLTRAKEVLYVGLVAVLAWSVTWILKAIFLVARPYQTFSDLRSLYIHDSVFDSFPSGHATFFMALAVAICLIHPRIGRVFFIGAFLIGVARIIAGIHYPIDIIAGYIIGGVLAYFLYKLGHHVRKTYL